MLRSCHDVQLKISIKFLKNLILNKNHHLSSPLLESIDCYIYCYSCVSTQPGCDEFYVDWRIHKAQACTNEDDKCVKIIEKRKGNFHRSYKI